MSGPVEIRPAATGDRDGWTALWRDYLAFYRASATDAVAAAAWARLSDPASGMAALVAEQDGAVVGLCNYLFHASFWAEEPTCYLQDLYVAPALRGTGVARRLILACEDAARAAGASRVYWLTQEYNAPARSLYDTLAQRTSFIVYRKPL
jgi:GNAT superfamily N-acetyltransferase